MALVKLTTRCSRCHQHRDDMEDGYKCCKRCRADKARYQKTEKGRLLQQKSKYNWIKSEHGRELSRAHSLVYKALKRGKITKLPCEQCGEKNVDAHHDDYSKKLDVRWLCKPHHRELHRVLG